VLTVHIRTVDVFDDAALASWHASTESTMHHDQTDPVYWPLAELRLSVRDPNVPRLARLVAADDGGVVGTGWLSMPTRENLTRCEIDIQVSPERRREGIGTALFERLRDEALANGRTSAFMGVVGPYDGEPVPPGVPFVRSLDLGFGNEEVRRRLKLPIPEDRLERLLESTRAHRNGYELETWEGACPEEYAEQYAALIPMLSVDAPAGDLQYEPEQYDVKRLRDSEQLSQAQGRRVFTTIALLGGRIVGHTQLAVPSAEHDPDRAYQWGTLVLREHRGHRLGLALKARNHQAVQAAIPDLRRSMHTWNARQNSWMIKVNELLGYQPVDSYMEYQGDLKD